MARTAVTVANIPKNNDTAADITWTAADAANNHEFVNDGKTLFLVKNGSGGVINVTYGSVADEHGRTQTVARAVASGAEHVHGPFRTAGFNQSDGTVQVDLDVDTTSYVAALRMQS